MVQRKSLTLDLLSQDMLLTHQTFTSFPFLTINLYKITKYVLIIFNHFPLLTQTCTNLSIKILSPQLNMLKSPKSPSISLKDSHGNPISSINSC